MSDEPHEDAIDDELRRRFDAGAPAAADPDAVLDAMRPRLRQARTRRRASFASAIAGVAVIVIVLAFALGSGGGGTDSVRVPPASHGPVSTVPPTPTPSTAPSGGSATPSTVPADDHGTDGAANGSSPTTPDETTPTEAPPTVPVTTPAARDEPYSSTGGSIVVHLENGQVSLASSSPAGGFTAEVHDNGPSRVEVRFSNGSTEWRIRVDVVNGDLVPEITQHG
jgi:hypothetical protein